MMFDMIYNCRQGELPTAEASEEWNTLCTRLEDTLNDEQIDMLHKLLDCMSDTAGFEMRAAYKAGFNDGVTLIKIVQE